MTPSSAERISRQVQLVEEHLRRENDHDIPGIMATFGQAAQYEDTPWSERHRGRDGVEAYYRSLLTSLPDLHIDVRNRVVNDHSVVLEVVISGTHRGAWRGLPATGRPVAFPLCGIYSFDADGKLAGERIYYDRASVLGRLGSA